MSTQEFEILRAQNEAIVRLGELIVELQMAAKALLERLESLDRREGDGIGHGAEELERNGYDKAELLSHRNRNARWLVQGRQQSDRSVRR